MSKKHFDEYFCQVAAQYDSMKNMLKQFEELAASQMVEPERIENAKIAIQPIKSSYEMLAYVKYLLDMPNRQKKQKTYALNNKKKIEQIDYINTQQGIVDQNSNALNNTKELLE